MSGAAISTRGTGAGDVRMCPRAMHSTWQPLLGAGSVMLGAVTWLDLAFWGYRAL